MTNEEKWGWIELQPKTKTNRYIIYNPAHTAVVPRDVEHNGERLNGKYYVNVYVKGDDNPIMYKDSSGKPYKPQLRFTDGNTNQQGVILPVDSGPVRKVGISIPPSEVCDNCCH